MANQNTDTRSKTGTPTDKNNPDQRQQSTPGSSSSQVKPGTQKNAGDPGPTDPPKGNPGNQKNAGGHGQMDPKSADPKTVRSTPGERGSKTSVSERDRED
jgi:hypothetical protein